jgi:hypothetical protein
VSDDDLRKDLSKQRPGKDEFEYLRETLRGAIAPLREFENGTDLRRDLWPDMLRRLEQAPPVRVPWFDWVLLGVAGAAAIFFPALIPALLYQL